MSTDDEFNAPAKLTSDELIRTELRGKFLAIKRYDSMVWRIRSGYVVVLYGTLTILGGTSGLVNVSTAASNRMLLVAVLLVCGFSVCGLVVDFFFLTAKYRVVNDADALMDLALRVATGKTNIEAEYNVLRELLHISGEKPKKVPMAQLLQAGSSIALIYLISPVLAVFVLYLLWTR
jgi:hypothetical protein